MSCPRRGEQHPFTPEPRIPEPWPDRDITPWEWADGEPGETGGSHQMLLLYDDELAAMDKWEKKRQKAWKKRGFSIGFGSL
jgi:hypothetical protein